MSKQDSMEIKSVTFRKSTLMYILGTMCDGRCHTAQLHNALQHFHSRRTTAGSSQAQSRTPVKLSMIHSHHSDSGVTQSCHAASSFPQSSIAASSSAAASSHAQSSAAASRSFTLPDAEVKPRKQSRMRGHPRITDTQQTTSDHSPRLPLDSGSIDGMCDVNGYYSCYVDSQGVQCIVPRPPLTEMLQEYLWSHGIVAETKQWSLSSRT